MEIETTTCLLGSAKSYQTVQNASKICMLVEHGVYIDLTNEQAMKMVIDYQDAVDEVSSKPECIKDLYYGKVRQITLFTRNGHAIIGLPQH